MTSDEADEILEKLDRAGLHVEMEPVRGEQPYNTRTIGWKLSVTSVAGWRTTAVQQLVDALSDGTTPANECDTNMGHDT